MKIKAVLRRDQTLGLPHTYQPLEAAVRVSEKTDRAAQARHLEENLIARLAKGREWATPGVEAALRRALGQVDAGIDVASPRLQATLRAIADELAGGVEAVTPRVHEHIARILPEVETPATGKSRGRWPGKPWLIVGAAIAAVLAGVTAWRVLHTAEPVPERREAAARETPPAATPPGPPSPLS
jgi:hypothetical protein